MRVISADAPGVGAAVSAWPDARLSQTESGKRVNDVSMSEPQSATRKVVWLLVTSLLIAAVIVGGNALIDRAGAASGDKGELSQKHHGLAPPTARYLCERLCVPIQGRLSSHHIATEELVP